MITRKKGETDKQFIKRLQKTNDTHWRLLRDQEQEIETLVLQKAVVPLSLYQDLSNKHQALIEKMMTYNLWTGE